MTRACLATAAMALLSVAPAAAAPRPHAPASVARAWSAALDRGDNEAAANLFAPNAVVVQGGLQLTLSTHKLAVLWNSRLPCTGRIVKLTVRGSVADATFVLGNRKTSKCDAPGQNARAKLTVRNGKIVRWEQLPVPASPFVA